MRTQLTPKTIRRLVCADGYLGLDLPQLAVTELRKVEDAGPLKGPHQLLMGIALKRSGDFQAAISHLETAARVMPSPVRRFAWRELVDCYRSVDAFDLADMAAELAGDTGFELRISLPDAEICLLNSEIEEAAA